MARLLPFLVFLVVALSLVGGMHYYLWARLVRDLQLSQPVARALTASIVVLGVTMPAALFTARLLPGAVIRPLV